MNLLGRLSSNFEAGSRCEEKPQPGRAFGRDLTNMLGGAIAKPNSKHKRATSELSNKEPTTKPAMKQG